jgi:C-terminal of Roc, COR, domain/CHAT domain
LNPEWLTKAMYAIIDDDKVINNPGTFNFDDIKRIWSKLGYQEEKYGVLIDLMQNSEFCFHRSYSDSYVIPSLLSLKEPEIVWSSKECLNFEFEYSFMPIGIMTKFILRNHEIIGSRGKFWRCGIFFASKDFEALVKEDRFKKKIMIQIRGTGDRKATLSWICREIETINSNYGKLEIEQKIPCSCKDCIAKSEPYLHENRQLLKAKGLGKRTVECKNSFEQVMITELLEGFVLGDGNTKGLSGDSRKTGSLLVINKTVLFLASNPSDVEKGVQRQRMDEEARRISESLRRGRYGRRFKLLQKFAATRSVLWNALLDLDRKPAIVHFSGYGSSKGEIILEDMMGQSQQVNVNALGDLFGLFNDHVECVILNACFSDKQAEELSKHIRYVVGLSDKIPEDAAIGFAEAFYDAIGNGRDVKFAYNLACSAIEMFGLEGRDAPVLKEQAIGQTLPI